MISGKALYHILIISGTQKSADAVAGLLDSMVSCSCETVVGGAPARRRLMESDVDMIIVNTPLGDEYGHELALYIAQKMAAGVILLVKNEQYEEVSARLEDDGVVTVAKPLSKPLFYQAIKLVIAGGSLCRRLEDENRKLRQKLKELTAISRAKCALIEFAHMTEEQAHRYIEKQAMDGRCTRGEVAEQILQTYISE